MSEGVPTGRIPTARATAPPVLRVRITFAKGPELRFIGHLDVVRLWERAARRARLPLAYTQGFTPHPRFTFAAPLALGATGDRELLDAFFVEPISLDDLRARLGAEMPPGAALVNLHVVDLDAPALMSLVRWAEFRATIAESLAPPDAEALDGKSLAPSDSQAGSEATPAGSRWSRQTSPTAKQLPSDAELAALAATGSPWRRAEDVLPPHPATLPLPSADELQCRIDAFLASDRHLIHRHRNGKTTPHDLRSAVLDLWLPATPNSKSETQNPKLGLLLTAGPEGAGRADEIAAVLGVRISQIHRRRIGLEGEPPSRSA